MGRVGVEVLLNFAKQISLYIDALQSKSLVGIAQTRTCHPLHFSLATFPRHPAFHLLSLPDNSQPASPRLCIPLPSPPSHGSSGTGLVYSQLRFRTSSSHQSRDIARLHLYYSWDKGQETKRVKCSRFKSQEAAPSLRAVGMAASATAQAVVSAVRLPSQVHLPVRIKPALFNM